MLEEEGIVGRNESTKRVKLDEKAHFFPQSSTMRTLSNINYCQEINKVDEYSR